MPDQEQTTEVGIPERGVQRVDPNQEPKTPRVVLSIHAHPDDQEFTIGGTLAKWAKQGARVITVCITSGDAGSNQNTPADMTPDKLWPIREVEQKAACDVLGVQEVVFLRYPDGQLTSTIALRRDLTRFIRKYKPDVVVTGDPTVRFYGNSYMNHPDHRVAADVACDAVFPSAGTRFIFPELLTEGLEPHEVSRIFLHGSNEPNTWIDISETAEAKVAALRQHVTQLGAWDPHDMMYEWAKEEGKAHGLALAESYRLMILKEEKPEEEAQREKTEVFAEATR
ncbi:MAG: PIG-L deacetylase family protein [Anaerolineae bacterium]